MTHNRLGDETSPYLRQHRDNPVHWYAWGDDAFAAAKSSGKPILLSVGYAACHWCHVMAHESFEDPDMASVMNELFINVKVDREERPDVDNIYQTALQLLGEHGGWPLTMFLTPDGDPFWGGTYFPNTPRYGRPGFEQVLRSISQTYGTDPERISENVAAIKDGLSGAMTPKGGGTLSVELLDEVAALAVRMVDPYHGGTQGAPKFPQPMFFRFLWHTFLRTDSSMFKDAVTITLDNICQGGIYDHLGGGFARYSTDPLWLAPHFEKMLYDNALLLELLSDVWLETRNPLYEQRATETIDWLTREMAAEHDAEGAYGLASALDADSEGEEGKFYVWDAIEIADLLGPDAAAFGELYDVSPHGNWEGKTILNLSKTLTWDADTEAAMAPLRETLLAAREHRVRPGRDDKVLLDWNGMLISALVRCGIVFERDDWLELAGNVFGWVKAHMIGEDGRFRHARCGGRLQHPAVLEDYANMVRAALFLFEGTAKQAYLDDAEAWAADVTRHYEDTTDGGYFMAAVDTADLVARPKPIMDNAVPAGNGIMAEVLARLFLVTGKQEYQVKADRLFSVFAAEKSQENIHHPTLMIGWELIARGTQIVIVGPADDIATRSLAKRARISSNRLSVVTQLESTTALPPSHPAAGKGMVDGKPAAYVCVGTTCSLPLTDPEALSETLGTPQ